MAHSRIFHALSVAKHFSDWSLPLRLGVPVCLAEYENYHILTSTVDNALYTLEDIYQQMLLAMIDEKPDLTLGSS